MLPQGYYSIGEHVECDDGTVRTRKGNLIVPWADTYRYEGHYDLRSVQRHGTIIDAIRYSDTVYGVEYVALMLSEKVLLCRGGSVAIELGFPPAFSVSPDARIIQAYDKIYILSGSDKRPLVWDGDISDGFSYADIQDLAGGYESFPNSQVGCYYKNRLWLKTEANRVLPSDILTADFKTVNEFWVNQGDSDSIRALVPYTNDRIICFKDNSMYSLDNLTGTLDSAEINLISNNMGIVSDRSAQVLGPVIFWLSRAGIMQAQLAYEQRLTPDTIPLSEPIQPIIDRINWAYAFKAVSAIYKERYFCAVPLDDNTSNSAVLIYNLKNQAWESVDTYTPQSFTGAYNTYDESFGPQTMTVLEYAGKRMLTSTTHAGCIALYRYNKGKQDIALEGATTLPQGSISTTSNTQFSRDEIPFSSVVQTRGYLSGDTRTKLGFHADLVIDTYDPEFDLSFTSQGPGESQQVLSGKTRDRTKRRDWVNSGDTSVVDNENNEHTNPYLDDYSIHLSSTYNSQTSSEYPQFYFGDSSREDVYVNRMQEFNERFRIHKRARAPRIKVTNSKGSLSLKGVAIKEYSRKKVHRREV